MAEDTSNNSDVQEAADDGEEARQNLDDMTVLQNDDNVDLSAEQQQGQDGNRNQAEDLQGMSMIQMGSRVMPDEAVTEDSETGAVETGGSEVESSDNEAPTQGESEEAGEEGSDGDDFAIEPPVAGVESQAGLQFDLPETETIDSEADPAEATAPDTDLPTPTTADPGPATAETAAVVEETEE
ncbi:hypothetical protein V5T57_19765, partial [Magnetococcus sp. PR-3]